MFPKTNIEEKLNQLRNRKIDPATWRSQVMTIFDQQHADTTRILQTLETVCDTNTNDFNIDALATDRIYHIQQIKKICIDYRLRFLDYTYFKGELPYEAITAIKSLEKTHQTTLSGYKIIAPSKLFKLENADDPLLFVPIGNDYYYLIHKWGEDLHPFRKMMMWFFKSFENLVVLTVLVSLLLTFLVPDGLLSKETTISTQAMVFLFMFKAVGAIVIFYGFALGKNFNTAIWDSTYFNA